MTVHFVRKDGDFDGPYDGEEIDELLERGELRFDDYVWTEGWTEWRQVGQVYPKYAMTLPQGDILTEEFRKLLNSAWQHNGERGNPVSLAWWQKVDYGIAAWACAQAEDRFRELIKIALQLIKRESPPDELRFRRELQELGFDFSSTLDAVAFLKQRQLIRAPGHYNEPFTLVRAELYTFDELVQQYASPRQFDPKSIPEGEKRVRYTGDRRCLNSDGKLLYVVTSKGRVLDANGDVLGTVMANGDVWDAQRQLIARRGDAGVLLRFTRNSET